MSELSELEAHLAHPSRPLPEILPEWQPYFTACQEGRLEIERCTVCERHQFYPRGQCTACGGAVAPLICSGRGRIYTVTTVRMNRDPGYKALTPYNLGIVEIEESVRMAGAIFGDVPRIGDPVEARFAELAGGGIWVAAWEVTRPIETAQ